MYIRTLLKGTILFLGVIALLSGCEEVMDPKPASKSVQPAQPTKLYTEIGADELIERWSVLPNGAVAEAESQAGSTGYRLASATDGFSDLAKHFVFKDARKYGRCVVFTLTVTVETRDDDENLVDVELPTHILDCVGEPVTDTAGLFHIAQMCHVYPDFILYVVRAGNADPKINDVEYVDGLDGESLKRELVSVSISTHPSGMKESWDDFTWYKHVIPFSGDEYLEPIKVHWAVGENWPHDDGGVRHDLEFETLLRESTHMRFSIDDSHGMVKFEDNDRAAHGDHAARCATLGEGDGGGGELTSER